MATDELGWTLINPFGTGLCVDGPEISLSAEVDVVPKTRAEAAEQRVRELLERLQATQVRATDARQDHREAESKLATAVEALRALDHYPSSPAYRQRVIRTALAKIRGEEQSDG